MENVLTSSLTFFLNILLIVLLTQGTGEYLLFAAISKLIAAAATYPYQVIRARLQDQNHSYKGTWDCIKQTWRYERMPGFYKGVIPYLVHVTPNICLVMIIYEKFTNPWRHIHFWTQNDFLSFETKHSLRIDFHLSE